MALSLHELLMSVRKNFRICGFQVITSLSSRIIRTRTTDSLFIKNIFQDLETAYLLIFSSFRLLRSTAKRARNIYQPGCFFNIFVDQDDVRSILIKVVLIKVGQFQYITLLSKYHYYYYYHYHRNIILQVFVYHLTYRLIKQLFIAC